ncbi:hypothetical protein A3Q56_02647 [Intoshia linei]|uniref:Uncharacterized protein n=1 Tax=Intoshia linei TaxID=1819745 RepID=A0A177B622_9BILA|nr:hypothetical protein A3Q56_02647 [Intoshia linei]
MLFDYPFKLNLFRTVNIHDYIWGYSDETLVKLNKQMYTTYPEVHGLIDKNLRNNSISERYEVWSGKKGTAIGDLVSYNYSRQLNYWNSENSNMLNGTDGSGWNPFVDKTRDLYIFDPELCRSISVQFDETALVRGIHTYQYKISPNIYQNPLKNRINVDFCKQNCLNGDINDKTNVNFCCTKTGNFNLMPCKMGEFVYSIPQYSQVDKFLRKSSIKPFEKTESWLKLEPVTGKVLCSQKQFTASLMIRNTHYVLYNGNEKINHSLLSDYAFPIYSLQERYCIDTKTAVMVAQIVFIVSYLEYIAYLLIVSGGAGLVSFAILTYRRSVNNRNIKIDTSSPIDLYSLTHVVQLKKSGALYIPISVNCSMSLLNSTILNPLNTSKLFKNDCNILYTSAFSKCYCIIDVCNTFQISEVKDILALMTEKKASDKISNSEFDKQLIIEKEVYF